MLRPNLNHKEKDALGYSLVVRTSTEDWWVDPSVIPYSEYKNFAKVMAY